MHNDISKHCTKSQKCSSKIAKVTKSQSSHKCGTNIDDINNDNNTNPARLVEMKFCRDKNSVTDRRTDQRTGHRCQNLGFFFHYALLTFCYQIHACTWCLHFPPNNEMGPVPIKVCRNYSIFFLIRNGMCRSTYCGMVLPQWGYLF